MLAVKLLTGIHLVGVGTFFSCALFLDFAVLPGLVYLPPDQATKLSRIVEPRFLAVSSAALALIALGGVLQMTFLGLWPQLGDAGFPGSARGQALVASVLLWTVLAASQAFYVLRLRPHLPQAFPFDAFRTSEPAPDATLRATKVARLIVRSQAVVCMFSVALIGGAVRYGG